jgi:hypothetical protein
LETDGLPHIKNDRYKAEAQDDLYQSSLMEFTEDEFLKRMKNNSKANNTKIGTKLKSITNNYGK